MPQTAGVDGCPGGWICVSGDSDGRVREVRVFGTFSAFAVQLEPDAIIAVDMPIGLPDRTSAGGRGAEQAVRPFLKNRQSSVFSVPSRPAVYAEPGPFADEAARIAAHRRAGDIALATSEPPRRVSIQAFGLFPKIRELDSWLREDAGRAGRVFESHPEFAFAVLNDGKPMTLPKKIKGAVNPAGMEERRALLTARGLDPQFLRTRPPRGANDDDFLDACVMLLIAGRLARGAAKPWPTPPGRDRFGLPIAIHA